MVNLEEVSRKKEVILSSIKMRGPSLPVQVARVLEVEPLFASAFLSELKDEQKIKVSNLRVGSSPLYFIDGHEGMLENFVLHLNQREREAFELLKKSGFLEDEKQNPVIRVALRAIKDFAIPLRVRVNGESKLFWKYFGLTDNQALEMIQKGSRDVKEEVKEEKKIIEEKKVKEKVEERAVEKKKKTQDREFGKKVRDYLSGKEFEILEVLSDKKREFAAKVRVDESFGKQVYYMIAKDKKSVSDDDLAGVLRKAQFEKMPALFLSRGELNKKGKEHIGEWGNLVKFERMKF